MYTTTEEDSVAPKRKWICEGERMRARYITIATQKLSKKKQKDTNHSRTLQAKSEATKIEISYVQGPRLARIPTCLDLGSLLVGDSLFFTHGANDGDKQVFTLIESCLNFSANGLLGDFNIILGDTILVHQVKETIVDVHLTLELERDNRA